MKVIFFGTGSYAKHLWTRVEKEKQIFNDDYLAFADNNKNLWASSFYGKRIIPPTEIVSQDIDLVVIASTFYEKDMRRQLVYDLGIPENKIYTWEDYSRLCYARNVYQKRYSSAVQSKSKTNESVKMQSTVVYTAITGNYDILKDPLFIEKDLAYVCFTNNQHIKSDVWDVKYIENEGMDDIHLARYIKMNPHLFFPDYDMSIWVDGKFQILDDLRKYAVQYRKDSGIVCFPHPERSCICDELAACVLWTNGVNRDMIIQVADYLKNGLPINYGLYDTGCMLRFHNDDSVKDLMIEWQKEIARYSFRDQLSFPYICWKKGYEPDICDLDIARNQWIRYTGHLSL